MRKKARGVVRRDDSIADNYGRCEWRALHNVASQTHEAITELLGRACPVSFNFPGRFGDEGGEREPVVVLVLLQVGKCEQQEPVELRCRAFDRDAFPYLSKHGHQLAYTLL